MKDQYFGDVNDYRKYGLLRVLVEAGHKRPMVVWMKTEPSDTGGDRTKYLTQPRKWMRHDPALFHFLRGAVIERNQRELSVLEGFDMIPGARYVHDLVPSDLARRQDFFDMASNAATAASADIVFLDPDIGLATAAMCIRSRRSVEHVYPSELKAVAGLPATLLLYQHWPMKKARMPFAAAFARTVLEATCRQNVHLLHTDHVLFALIPAGPLAAASERALELLRERWGDQFRHSTEETGSGEHISSNGRISTVTSGGSLRSDGPRTSTPGRWSRGNAG